MLILSQLVFLLELLDHECLVVESSLVGGYLVLSALQDGLESVDVLVSLVQLVFEVLVLSLEVL